MKSRMLVVVGVVVLLNVTASRVMAQAKTKAEADDAKWAAYDECVKAGNAYSTQKGRWGDDDGKQETLIKGYIANAEQLTEEQRTQALNYLSEAQTYLDDADYWLKSANDNRTSGNTAFDAGYKPYNYYKPDYTAAWQYWTDAYNYYAAAEYETSTLADASLSSVEAAQSNASKIIYGN